MQLVCLRRLLSVASTPEEGGTAANACGLSRQSNPPRCSPKVPIDLRLTARHPRANNGLRGNLTCIIAHLCRAN